ncbi:MAG: plasmid recombination protein [Rhodoferax sp.]|uniref:plasmid recombination protein n=1 Tax=Rhodoferax sp. TaxID=50421 RepID=UPI00260AF9A6|nr:plasmid recombination protein [Rhodoferax sp.]MDD5336158.1 plasmid recombination protein [Rhodoferax sp.]
MKISDERPSNSLPAVLVRVTLDVVCCALAATSAVKMSGATFLRIKKLKGSGIIAVAARHNRRVIQSEIGATGSIDPTRSGLNETLQGPSPAADVGLLAKDLMTAAGVTKLRKDAVMALEIVFSLSPDHQLDDRAYFTDCAAWAGGNFGGAQNILSVDIHRDEAAPHCHVLLLPLIDNRMDGSNMLGGKQKLMSLQKDFYSAVAVRYGLTKAPARLSGNAKQATATAVLQRLRETNDKALQSKMWPTIRDKIENDPAAFLMPLGMEVKAPAKKLKTMATIFTGKGKGNVKEANPIGFTASVMRQTLCSVGFTPNPPSPRTAKPLPNKPAAVGVVETVRVRDCDLDPNLYDQTIGEFRQQPPSARNNRAAADAWVSTALNKRAG